MTREELKALGIDGETLEKVMALHGKDIEKYKNVESENQMLKKQVESTNSALKDLQEKANGNEELVKQIESMKEESAKAKSDFEETIKTMKINSAVDNLLTSKKAKNIKAAKALLDMEKVGLDDKGNVIGLNEQWDSIYKGNEFMFGDSPSVPPSAGNPGSNPPDGNKFTGFREIR